jgi:hypothetical protein
MKRSNRDGYGLERVGKRSIITDDDAEEWLSQLPTIEPGIA